MAKQSNLEKKGIEERNQEIIKNDYSANDEYSSTHDDALSHPDSEDKPWGKGTGHGGHTYFLPDSTKSKDQMNYSNFDTFNGGGSYDIYGREGVGGRVRLTTINLYSQDNAYGVNSVDTTLNQMDGQYIVK